MKSSKAGGEGIWWTFLAIFPIVFLATATARAQSNFFDLKASGNGGPAINASGPTLLKLLDNTIEEQNQFAALRGTNLSGNLSWGGVPNAVQFGENAAQTSASITIPSTGFSKTFTATSSNGLESQIRTFLEQDGASAYGAFIKSMDQTSTVSSVDGNPQAATAFLASDAFERFGTNRTGTDDVMNAGDALTFNVYGRGGYTTTSGLNGGYAQVGVEGMWKINDNVGLSLDTVGQYREVEGSEAYAVGETVGIPITFINRSGPGFSWTLTPWGMVALAASYDQVSGSILVGAGATSDVNYQIQDWTFTVADQASYAGDVAVVVDQYTFYTPVNQWIVKNGGELTWNPWQKFLFLDGGIAYSVFVHKAAVPNYWTANGGVGIRVGRYSSLRVGYLGDFARDYHSNGGEASITIAF